MSCIEIKNVTKIYSKNNVHALNNISAKFEMNKFYVINGKSGSGKSTLIQILGILDKINNGDILINNKSVIEMNEQQISKLRMEKIGFIFQSFYLDNCLKAYENVMLPMLINKKINKSERKAKAIELLKQLGLEDRINHYPSELSGGEQQRVAIARALANNPDIILADEPTGNLDPENENIVLNILKNLSKNGKCIIMVTHSQSAINYADKVFFMEKGVLKDENN